MANRGDLKWVYTFGQWELLQLIEGNWIKLGEFTPHQKTVIDGLILNLTSTGKVQYLKNNTEAEYIIPRRV